MHPLLITRATTKKMLLEISPEVSTKRNLQKLKAYLNLHLSVIHLINCQLKFLGIRKALLGSAQIKI